MYDTSVLNAIQVMLFIGYAEFCVFGLFGIACMMKYLGKP